MVQKIIPLVNWKPSSSTTVRSDLPIALLINPPLWSAYAPYLAIPLLAGTLREHGKPVQCLDLNIEFIDFALSRQGMSELGQRLISRRPKDESEKFVLERARVVLPGVIAGIDAAKDALRATETLSDDRRYLSAQILLRDAVWVISAAFEGLSFDLTSSDLQYSQPSSRSVLAAAGDTDTLYRWAFDKILPKALQDPRIGLVGISITAETQLTPAITAARIVKTLRPDIKIVAGGNYTTRMISAWKDPLHPFAELLDYCILYEGEQSLVMLYERLFEGLQEPVPGLVERVGQRSVPTPAIKVNLKHAAKPAYDLMPVNKYLAPGPVLPVYASRGCAWKCTFCSIPYASGSFRMRTPEEVANEVLELCKEHRTRYFMFVDEIMTLRSLREVSRELTKLGSPVFWYAETRFSKQWTREDAVELFAGGCRRLDFGLESYNQRVLDLMKKDVEVAYIRDNIEHCLAAGISVHLFAMFGFPTETLEEAKNTAAFCEEIEARSRELYGNPYSSWGASQFTIDIHSPVGQRPEEFRVKLVEPVAGNDLQLWRGFEYIDSATASAAEIAGTSKRARNEKPISDVARFHLSNSKVCEEDVFLRNCLGLPFPSGTSRLSESWAPGDYQNMVRLNESVRFSVGHYSVLRAREADVGSFYCSETGYLIECAASSFEPPLARQWQPGRTMRARFGRAFGDAGSQLFEAMCRFGLLEVQGVRSPIDWQTCEFEALRAEHTVVQVALQDGRRLLISTATGLSVELGVAESLLWEIVQSPEGLSGQEALALFGSVAQREELANVTESLVKHGFCYVQARETVAAEEVA